MSELVLPGGSKPQPDAPKRTHEMVVMPPIPRAEDDPLACPHLSLVHVLMVPNKVRTEIVPQPIAIVVACMGAACAVWDKDPTLPRGGQCGHKSGSSLLGRARALVHEVVDDDAQTDLGREEDRTALRAKLERGEDPFADT